MLFLLNVLMLDYIPHNQVKLRERVLALPLHVSHAVLGPAVSAWLVFAVNYINLVIISEWVINYFDATLQTL